MAGRRCLIPRPETEQLLELAEAALAARPALRAKGALWADLGTGSGALALGLASLLPSSCTVGSCCPAPALAFAAGCDAFDSRCYEMNATESLQLSIPAPEPSSGCTSAEMPLPHQLC